MAFWGQEMWLVGAFALSAFLCMILYVLADLHVLNPQQLGITDWFFSLLLLFYGAPIILALVYGRIKLALGYPKLTLTEQQKRSYINTGFSQSRTIGFIWLFNIFGLILAPVAIIYLISKLFSL